jgi:radical SAM superfamily enzyme YgiQ (UPF0313 family)
MRVLFVYPNLYTQMGFNHGLASLSAVLKAKGHETRLVNLNENLPPVPTDEQVFQLVRDWGPGMIAFSCLTQQYRPALALARFLRARAQEECLPLPPLVVGGVHPTMVPEDVMGDGVWDHVGVGECEDALLRLVERIDGGAAPDDVANFLSWRGGARPERAEDRVPEHWVHNPVGEFPDLAGLPMPDYELFDTQRITDQKRGWFGLMTSRGCPYRCTYCLNHEVIDRYRAELGRRASEIGFFRFRRPEDAVEEIRWVLERYEGIRTFILDDDLFTQTPAHAIAFCDAYAGSGIGVPFVVNAHVKKLDPAVAAALARAGCRILKLGVESGSPRVRRDVLQRYMRDDDILGTSALAEEHGLHTSGFVMVGLPTETHAERWETVDLLARALLGRFRVSRFFPFPGTVSYRMSLEAGQIDPERMATLTDFTESSCLSFGAEEDLFVDKLATCMAWFVNARLDRYSLAPSAERYRPLADRVLRMESAEWEAFRSEVRAVDAEISDAAARAGELHYAIRYEASMGVRSDWFLAEEAGVEWTTAAARPVPERLRALTAAAGDGGAC